VRVNWTALGILTKAKCEREPTIPDPVMSTETQDLRPGAFSAVPAGLGRAVKTTQDSRPGLHSAVPSGLSSGTPGSHATLKAQ
jgi:hypothetical protein